MDDWQTRVTKIRLPRAPVDGTEGIACLVLIYPAGPDLGKRFELTEDLITIGRVADCTIQIDRDSVSRKHARLENHDGVWQVFDQESTNGTYVNDQPITSSFLGDGDLLKVGNTIFKFLTGGNIEAAYHEEIYRMTIIDGLTQAHNKRFLVEQLARELARCGRSKRPLSLVMFDIDHFKLINDEHGHLTGDFILRDLVRRVRPRVRRDEILARYGGEEFTVVLPEAPTSSALQFAEQIRVLVEREPFVFEGESIRVTISLGVATVAEEVPADTLIKAADDNLYRAKETGRNRVVG